jgi:hypothetical protein
VRRRVLDVLAKKGALPMQRSFAGSRALLIGLTPEDGQALTMSEGRAIPLAWLPAFAHEGYGRVDAAVSPLHESVGERLHEAHQRFFLFVREADPSHELGVHVGA